MDSAVSVGVCGLGFRGSIIHQLLGGEGGLLIFREVAAEVREVKVRLAILGDDSSTVEQDKQKLDFLLRIVAYINSFIWLKKKSARRKLRDFLRSKYNYREIAEKYGVTVGSMHMSVSYVASQLKKRIGGVLDLLRSGDIAGAEREFEICTGCYDDLFVRVVRDHFKPEKDAGVDLSTCEKELSFLSAFVSRNIENLVAALDRQKVEHLLYILLKTDDRSYSTIRSQLFRSLEGELEASEALALVEGYELSSRPSLWF